jgi:hypothetical protein
LTVSPLIATGLMLYMFVIWYVSGLGTTKCLRGFRSRNEPLPNGTEPIFHEIFRCLSVSTPTVVEEDFFSLRLSMSEIDALVDGVGLV